MATIPTTQCSVDGCGNDALSAGPCCWEHTVEHCQARWSSEFSRGECARTDTETVEMFDGGKVRLCPLHRSWAAAMGRA